MSIESEFWVNFRGSERWMRKDICHSLREAKSNLLQIQALYLTHSESTPEARGKINQYDVGEIAMLAEYWLRSKNPTKRQLPKKL